LLLRDYPNIEAISVWSGDENDPPVYGKIFRMSELKSQLSNLKQLDCVDGKHFDRYGRGEAVVKTAKISVLEKDQLVLTIEEEIEKLQEELDEHNATTSI
jgi:hypothetical protein